MPAIFISHSSLDNKPAEQIKAWLAGLGFERVFLDFDKDTGIGAGVGWEKTLHDEIARCHAVLLVLTPDWLASKWCFAELQQARALGKVILPVVCSPIGDHKVLPDIQAVDIVDWNEDGLKRVEQRLSAITNDLARGFTFPANRPPYPGVYAFESEDAAIYFGRDEEARAVIEKLDARRVQGGARMVLSIGASGAGKSSLLKAGVLPQLGRRTRQWFVLPPVRPEKAPLEALAKALSQQDGKPDTWREWHGKLKAPGALQEIETFLQNVRIGNSASATVLLPIDQFEEVFTIAEAGEREAFLALLAAVLDPAQNLPVLVVATGRADVLGGLLEKSALAPLTETISLLSMALASVPRVIEGPAEVAGISVDRDLTAAILGHLENAEALPLLAQMLHLLYLRCNDKHFTLTSYLALGDPARDLNPVQNSVRLAADEAVRGVNPSADEMAALRESFVPHLVRLRLDDRKLVRQPSALTDLPRGAERLVKALTAARLLTIRLDGGAASIEVTHEAIFAAWPTLSGWLAEDRDFLADIERLKSAYETWQKAPASDKSNALLSGLLLTRARHWLNKYPQRFVGSNLTSLRDFITESARAADAALERAARLNRRLFQSVSAAAIILAVAAASVGLLYYQADEARGAANTQRQIAVARQALAVSQAEASVNTECSLDLAVSAYDGAKSVPGFDLVPFETAVRTELAHSRVTATLTENLFELYPFSWRPDGSELAFVDDSGKVWQGKNEPGAVPKAVDGLANAIAVEWAPDGRQLLVSTKGGIELWDASLRQKTKTISLNGNDLEEIRWNRTGTRVIARSFKLGTLLIDMGSEDTALIAPAQPLWGGHTWSPDGQRVAVGVRREVWIIDANGRLSAKLQQPASVMSVTWSPDGKLIAAGLEDGQIWIMDAATGARQQTLSGHTNQVTGVDFSPDGSNLVSASWDNSLIVWDTRSWRPKEKLTGHSAGIQNVRWSPSGDAIASKASDGTIRIWSPDTSLTPSTWLRTAGWVWSVGWSRGEKTLAAVTDKEVVFRDQAGKLKRIAEARTSFLSGGWFAGDIYAFAEQDGTVSVFKPSTGETLLKQNFGISPLFGIDVSPDGRMVSLASLVGLQVRDVPGGALRHQIQEPAVTSAFSPDGKFLAYGPHGVGTINIVNVETWKVDRTLRGIPKDKAIWGLAWSHDGKRLAAASDDGVARVWDLARPDQPRLFQGHSSDVKGIAWSKTDQQLATASLDGTARVWDASSGRTIAVLSGHASAVRSVAWSDDSRFIATGSEDGTARMFFVGFDDVLKMARQQTTHGLTASDHKRCQLQLAPAASPG